MSWHKVNLPKNIVARPVDNVSYYAIKDKTKTSHMAAACYASHMGSLSSYTFDCVPCNADVSILPNEDFFLWMKYCTACGFAPSGTIPYTKGKMNCCLIHGAGENRHRIYAGLCCYRWAESLAPMVYEVCRLIEKRPDVNFYRIFHYLTGKYISNMGHNFTCVSNVAGSLYSGHYNQQPRLNHIWGLWPKFFFSPGINLSAETKVTGYTQSVIAGEIQNFNLNLLVKDHEDLMDDKWEELYNLETIDKKKIKAVYDRLK